MHEYCPLCLKNGNKVRIKSFQLNFQEAVLMCATQNCIWPFGHENLLFFNRPVGKEWSKNWDESALKYIRSEQDMLPDLSSYTPPQTPSNEVSNCNTTSSILINEKVSNPVSILSNNNLQQTKELHSVLNKPSIETVNSNINNRASLKPKVVGLKHVNFPLERNASKGYSYKKKNTSNDGAAESKIETINCKSVTNIPTSLVSNVTCVKDNKLSDIFPKTNVVKDSTKIGLKSLDRRIKKKGLFEKFDFQDLMKSTSTNGENESNVDSLKTNRIEEKSKLNFNDKVKQCSSNVLLKSNDESSRLQTVHKNSTKIASNNGGQLDENSILALSNSSKDSGVDQDLVEKDFNLQLDELLQGFTNNDNSLEKNDVNIKNDYDWIDSLFE